MKNRKCPNRSHCWDYKSGNCENCDLGDHITKLHKKIDRLKAKNEELIYKLECLLCHATGGLLSKHTYDLRTMESAVTDYVEKCCDEARAEAKSEVAHEIFSEFELHIRKADEGWLKQLKFEIEKYKMDMIMARLGAFGYCIYVLNNLREKYTEGETNGNKAGTEI